MGVVKRLLVVIGLLFAFNANSQVLTNPNVYGYQFRRLVTDSLFAVPTDTFSVPVSLRTYPFIARKGTTLYLWNTSTFAWGALVAGGDVTQQALNDTAAAIRADFPTGGGGSPAGNYGNVQLNRNGALATPASDSLDFDGGLSIKGTLKVTSLGSGANTDSVVTVNTSTNLFNKKRAAVINISNRDSGDIIEWNGTEHVYVPKPTAATNLIGNIRFRIGDTNAPSSGDSLLTNTGLINKFLFVWRNGKLLDSNSTNGYTFTRSTGVVKFKPVFASADTINIQAYDTTSVYRIALETIVLPSVDLDLAANRSNLTKTGTVFTPTANNTTFDAYGQDALKIPSGQSGRFYSQYVTSGDNTYMLFVNTSSSFLPYSNANSHGLYVNGSNQIQPLNSGTPGSSVGSVTAGSWYGIYRDIGAGNIRIQSSTDGVSWTDVATLSAYSSADLYLSIVIYSTSGKKVSNPKGQGVL